MQVTLTQRLTSSLSLVCETTPQDSVEAQEVLEQLAEQLKGNEALERLSKTESNRQLEALERASDAMAKSKLALKAMNL
jgi:hypothetical protein